MKRLYFKNTLTSSALAIISPLIVKVPIKYPIPPLAEKSVWREVSSSRVRLLGDRLCLGVWGGLIEGSTPRPRGARRLGTGRACPDASWCGAAQAAGPGTCSRLHSRSYRADTGRSSSSRPTIPCSGFSRSSVANQIHTFGSASRGPVAQPLFGWWKFCVPEEGVFLW